MLHLHHPTKPEKVIVIAETNGDIEFLHFLYDSHIIFGLWTIYDARNVKDKNHEVGKFLAKNYPLATGMAQIQVVEK